MGRASLKFSRRWGRGAGLGAPRLPHLAAISPALKPGELSDWLGFTDRLWLYFRLPEESLLCPQGC